MTSARRADDPPSHVSGDTDAVPAEIARLAALRRLNLLDTPRSEVLDRITRTAAAALAVPIVLISLVDEKRQWFKSRVGLDATETPRAISFCAHAVTDRRPLVVPDATLDVRFAGNPMVTGAPHLRAYAGIPLYTSDGHAIGALCAIDRRPRQFSTADLETLRAAARDVEVLIQRETAAAILAPADEAPFEADAVQALLECIVALRGHVRRRAELTEAARIIEERMRLHTKTPAVPVSYWNSQLRCEFANEAHCERFGLAPEQLLGSSMQDALGRAFDVVGPCARRALLGEQRTARATAANEIGAFSEARCLPDRAGTATVRGIFLILT